MFSRTNDEDVQQHVENFLRDANKDYHMLQASGAW